MDKKGYLQESFHTFGLDLNERQVEQFLIYAELLVEWNQKMNLTTITEFEDVVWKHFIDSAAVYQTEIVSRETWKGRLIDVGTGAGFPGIPLKIICPECKVTLLDSLNKRIAFLNEVVKSCKLKNILTVHGRAEDFGQHARFRENYDLCVSRAVANLATLSEYCLPFVKRGGYFMAYKAADVKGELEQAGKAIKVFGGEVKAVDEFVVRGSNLNRSLILVRKVNATPKKYPRKAGVPGKSPIVVR